MDSMIWRKSSYSGANGGDCIEVATSSDVFVRDSKDVDGPVLAVSPAAWRRLIDEIRNA
jgi:hypothetical protein